MVSRRLIPSRSLVGSLLRVFALAVGATLWPSTAAVADSTTSSNWSGYVAHRTAVQFRSVGGEWRIPTAQCAATSPGFSSVWVGLGGYSGPSNALEQTGIELDCSSSGHATYAAWYELVPAPVRRIRLAARPGDVIRAQVALSGRRVTITLQNLTRRRSFRRTFAATAVDVGSADWIVEAPSSCDPYGNCQTLPLADFGQTRFSAARATTVAGRSGAISSQWWSTTALTLVAGGGRFGSQNSAAGAAEAIPSSLTSTGSAFTDVYQ